MATVEFSKFADILSAALSQHHLLGFEKAQILIGIPDERFQILKDDTVKVLQCASKFGKPGSGHRTRKGQFSFQSQKKDNAKEYSNHRTIAFISHASKVMLKIFQARLQQYLN